MLGLWRAGMLAAALHLGLSACGSDVVVDAPASAGVGGSRTQAASSAASGGAPFGRGGEGGVEMACGEIAIITVEPGPGPFEHACPQSWGSSETACPLGYYQLSGPARALLIEGCYGRDGARPNRFRLEAPVDSQEPMTWDNVNLEVGIYWSNPRSTSVTVTSVDQVGGFIEGTFETVLVQLDQDFDAIGTFRVKRVQDLALP